MINDPHSVEGAHIIDDNGVERICVYTDGSCAMPKHPYLTHAGWGVAYGNAACTQNDCGLLASPVQTSYRAELRGVAQAIARVQCPAVFCVDCKSVVNQANNFMSTGVRDATKATEIWEFIYDRLELDVDCNIKFKWVPSHLDDKDKSAKRKQYLGDGTIVLADIIGNARADELADDGARSHNIDPYVLVTARDRARLTACIQEHLVASWCRWNNHTRGHSQDSDQAHAIGLSTKTDDKKDNEEDELLPDAHDHEEGEQEYDQFDEMDDFAPIDFNGNSSETLQPSVRNQGAQLPDAVSGGGDSPLPGAAGKVPVTLPPLVGANDDQPPPAGTAGRGTGKAAVPSKVTVTFDDSWKAKVTGGTQDASSSIENIASSMRIQHPVRWQTAEGEKYQLSIPKYDIDNATPPKELNRVQLHAITWWLSRLTYSASLRSTCHGNKKVERASAYSQMSHFQCTFFELAIALEAETNVCLGGAYADVQKKSNLLQTALRFLCKHSKMQFQRIGREGDNKQKRLSYKQLFEAAPQHSTRPITGVWLYGIERKPHWLHGDYTEDVIAANLFRARIYYEEQNTTSGQSATGNILADQAKSFGIGFYHKVKHCKIHPQWTAPPKMQIECDIHAHCDSLLASNATSDSNCHFGHSTQARKYKQDLLPLWRGAHNGAILCYKCRHRLNFEVDTRDHPVVTTVSMPPNYRRSPVIHGPCVFGHKTTSSQGKYGVAVWHQIPEGKTWRGAVAKDALCSACFQKMKRSSKLEDTAKDGEDHDMSVDEYFESIRKRARLAIDNASDKVDQAVYSTSDRGNVDGMITESTANDVKKNPRRRPFLFFCC